ncbi:cyclodeaminase/cyclohydrolase family protein [Caproiciproducens sp. MSJ-32]|uniref:cyclodeaminase/cyclohydrolase family protein n=1 Tax=Caproiciproducens sp. MSJ-32 TaxID=2841527 RepID=UPI001C10560F|nr:cyclodeaminase/cyclohydrolase family protein [Caproiciproducens sp. MSJ-32]MBU5456192.1 cyclodeaminase/cyclohydrolase family protein [Caproiciproducens sp. MSJ-32]
MLFKDYTLEKFIQELSSKAPSPGGGSTAALVGALAASLNAMVYSLTIGKKAFNNLEEQHKENMLKFNEEALVFIASLMNFMEKDREDFLELMNSYKLPKETENEIIERKKIIKENTLKAMKTPLNLARECIKLYKNISFAVSYGNKNLSSDAGVAAVLLHAAIESAIINVKVNLNLLRNDLCKEEVNSILEECNKLLRESSTNKINLLKEVENIIYPE